MYPVIPRASVTSIGSTSVKFDLDMEVNRTYLLTSSVACWVAQGANPTAVPGANPGNMHVGAGQPPIVIRGDHGAKLAIRTAATALVHAFLDLDTPSVDLDTIVEAIVPGSFGNLITVAAAADNDALTAASLDLDTPSAALDTIVEATSNAEGAAGNDVTVSGIVGASVLISQIGNAVTLRWVDGVTTITVLEAAIAAYVIANPGTALIQTKTGGTGITVLSAADVFAATALAGGLDSEGVTLVETSTTVVIHYADGESTVADVEAEILASSTLIRTKTAGTGATVLVGADAFAATALASGAEAGFASLVPCQE